MNIIVRDTHEASSRWNIVDGVLTEKASVVDNRTVTVELVPGEGDVPEREAWYDSGKSFSPQRLSFSWVRRDGGGWERGATVLEGQGFSKSGIALKGRTRRDDGSLGFRHPLIAGQDPNRLPEQLNRPWIRALIDQHDPALGWPQKVLLDAGITAAS